METLVAQLSSTSHITLTVRKVVEFVLFNSHSVLKLILVLHNLRNHICIFSRLTLMQVSYSFEFKQTSQVSNSF